MKRNLLVAVAALILTGSAAATTAPIRIAKLGPPTGAGMTFYGNTELQCFYWEIANKRTHTPVEVIYVCTRPSGVKGVVN